MSSTNAYIQEKLACFAKENNVRILFAIESGSRAWGFPSKDSDYDVRFVYAKPLDDYLSIKPCRDVIESDIIHDDFLKVPLDMNGWDTKKALGLAVKSNAVLVEWLSSPIRYLGDDDIVNKLLDLANNIGNIELIATHYHKITSGSYKQIQENENEAKLKLYCYAIRPALAYLWIRKFNTTPPMDMDSLLSKLSISEALMNEINKLITLKSTSSEGDKIPRNKVIDEFIEVTLADVPKKVLDLSYGDGFKKADKVFKDLIS